MNLPISSSPNILPPLSPNPSVGEPESNTSYSKIQKAFRQQDLVSSSEFDTAPSSVKPIYAPKGLGDTGTLQLAHRLSKGWTTSALILTNNGIGDSGANRLFASLHQNTQVEHLIMGQNHLSDFAMAGLADLLKVNHYIGWLVLNSNAVGTFGFKQLGLGLKENKSVKHLVLSDSDMDDDGLMGILDGLLHHPKIESLFIQANRIQAKGIKGLMSFISNTTAKLKRIDISNNLAPTALINTLRHQCREKEILLKS